MGLKNKKFRILPDKDEPLPKMIAKTYSETYTKYNKIINDGIRGAPAKIKASRYYNAKVWLVFLCIIFTGIMVMVLQKGIDEKQDLINEYKANIAAADELLAQPQYILPEDSFKPAVEAADSITEILNEYLDFNNVETAKKLQEWLSQDCMSDAFNWGESHREASENYSWSNYINWAETDDDVIRIIFICKKSDTIPVLYEMCDYSISSNKLINRKEMVVS